MTIGDLIGSNNVIDGLRAADKTQLLQELARRAGAALSLDQRVILDALQARENLGSTGLGKGFALPHARLDGLPVNLMIFLLTPANAGNQHLATLAALARPLRNEAFVQRLRQAPDAIALHKLLAEP